MAAKKRSDTNQTHDVDWLGVVGRSLAYLCLRQAQEERPGDFVSIIEKVEFLENLGLPLDDAAKAVGSSVNSVQVMRSRRKGKARGKKS